MNKLVEEIIKPILEANTKIKKVVGVYGGRFQPFGPHHYKTYKWLSKQVDDAKKSVSKIKNSGKKHAHKIQAAVAMEQRAREMGKTSQAAVYRAYINKMKKKTEKKNENVAPNHDGKSAPFGSGYKKTKKKTKKK